MDSLKVPEAVSEELFSKKVLVFFLTILTKISQF